MWRWIWAMGCFISLNLQAQKKWDGGANTENWSDALNWYPDGVPAASDDVLFDNSFITGNYRVLLPAANVSAALRKLSIRPSSFTIIIELPVGNTASPGLLVDSLIIHDQGIFINASGAASGSGLSLNGSMAIMNGGKYTHRTARSNAGIIDKLALIPETSKGIFEFDVPGTAGYTVSLTGNNFGSLYFSAAAAGGTKSYSGSGAGTLAIRGDLVVEAGAQVTSTLTADIVLGGDLVVNGRLNLNPSTTGASARSLRFNGNTVFRGSGQLSMNANFREMLVEKQLSLQRDLQLPLAAHTFRVKGSFIASTFLVDGPGSFFLADSATLNTAHADGIALNGDLGSIRTALRTYGKAIFLFTGLAAQQTGDALPDTVSALGVNNPSGLTLTKMSYIRDSLLLFRGKILSSAQALLTLGSPLVRSPVNRYGRASQGWDSSFIEGPLGVLLRPGQQFYLPLGRDTVFAPLSLLKTDAGEESIIVSYAPGTPPGGLPSPLVHWRSNTEYWQFSQPLASAVTLGISLRPWSLPALERTDPVTGIFTGSWLPAAGSVSGEGYRWLLCDSALSQFSAISPALVQQSPVLPLRLLDFQARDDDSGILLQWDAEEDGTDLVYTIMKSANGRDFREAGKLRSSGRHRASHQWRDHNPYPITYYQLLMEANSGQWSSKVIRKTSRKIGVRLYPNPVQDEMNIFFSTPRSRYEVEVVSLYGTVCKKFVCNTANCQVRLGNLKKGFYLIRINDESGLITLPFTKN